MTGAATELPIAGPHLSPGVSQTGGSAVPVSRRTSMGASAGSDLTAIQATGSGSFRSNWQAMLASLETPTGVEGKATGAGFEASGESATQLGGSPAAEIGSSSRGEVAGKGSASAIADGTSASDSMQGASSAASTQSAGKLARLQQLGMLQGGLSFSARSISASASSALPSRTSGLLSSHSSNSSETRSSSASDSSNPATASPDSASVLPHPGALLAGNTPQAVLDRAQRNDSTTSLTESGNREPASSSDSASRAHHLAVSSATSQPTSVAASETQANAIAGPSASAPDVEAPRSSGVPNIQAAGESSIGGNSNGLNSASAVSGPIAIGASNSASVAISPDELQPDEAALSAASSSAGRRAVSGSNSTTDRSARSVQASQHAPGADVGTGPWFHSTQFAQGSSAQTAPASTIGAVANPFTASGAAPATVTGGHSGQGSGSSSGSTAASASETFAALDGDASAGNVTWTHTGAHRAEAGFEDPALGWVGVRADLEGGSVHASLVPGSAEAAQMLGSHLAGLNEYLAGRHPGVDAVTVAGHENSGSPANAQSGSGNEAGSQSGSQSFTPQDSASHANNHSTLAGSNTISRPGEGTAESLPLNSASPVAGFEPKTIPGSSGRYISVMA
jgi:hypothetical protein